MRLALQIFRKDVERLWWAIVLTLALLAIWTYQEAAASTTLSSIVYIPQGSWLNLGLPFAWCVLTALAIQQDSLVGDRQFWVALPCGWRPLLAAKAAFIALFIHVPYFLATAAVLLARGFNPAAHVPHLFWKQAVLLTLTLPAFAASVLVKNLAHFVLLAIVIASAVVLMSNRFNIAYQAETAWDIRWALALIVLATGAAMVVNLQFIRRSTLSSRALGAIAAIAALSVYNWLPRETTAAIFAAFHPAPESRTAASIQPGSQEPDRSTQQRYYNYTRPAALIPLVLNGGPGTDGLAIRFNQISLEIIAANGERYEADAESNRIVANLFQTNASSQLWQALWFDNPTVWGRIRSGPATIRARMLIGYYRSQKSSTLRSGERNELTGTGWCVADSFRDPRPAARTISSVECESPETASRDISMGMSHDGYVSLWGYLTEHRFYPLSPYPQDPWLSPLHRGTYATAGGPSPTWVITPQTLVGSAVIDYTIPNIDLNRFVVHEPAKQEAAK